GAGEILLTSMDRDGTYDGFDIPITRRLSEELEIPIIASGGVGNPEHMYKGFADGKADAALAASIFHFGEYTVGDVKEYLKEKSIPVRI
uniref:HisA/HisF-related TIM barrel protein n=1 Tax=Methanomethylovorans sp. TaxID=2758717 RepID=UPI00351C881C